MNNRPGIYQVSVSVRIEARDEALRFMTEKHIPEVIATGGFSHAEFLIEEVPDPTLFAWSTLYRAERIELIRSYVAELAPALRKDFEDTLGAYIVSVSRKILVTP